MIRTTLLALACLATLLTVTPGPAAAEDADRRPVALDARLAGDEQRTRLVIDL